MAILALKLSFKKEALIKNRVLLIGIGIAFLSIWYGYSRLYKSTRGAIQQLNVEIVKEKTSTEVSKRLATLQHKLETYKTCLVKETDMLWLVDRVSKAANESGLKVAALNSKPLVPLKGFIYSSVNLAVTGTFHQLGDFVSKIEGSKEFMHVEKLFFNKDKEFLKAEIIVSTYFCK